MFNKSLLFCIVVFVFSNVLCGYQDINGLKVSIDKSGISFEQKNELTRIQIKSQFKDSEYKKKIVVALEKVLDKQHSHEKIDITGVENIIIEQNKKTEDKVNKVWKSVALGASGVAVGALGAVIYLFKRFTW